MNEQEAFIRAIVADRDDDAPRLVYADWLEEHARSDANPDSEWGSSAERAELIRVQIALARLLPANAAIPLLRRRERELLQRHQRHWMGALRDLCSSCKFERGFPEEITVNANVFVRRGSEIVAIAPTARRLRLQGIAQHIPAIAASPILESFTSLIVRRPHVPADALAEIIASPRLQQLTELDLSNNWLMAQDILYALNHRYPPKLERLNLTGCPIGVTGIRHLMAKNAFPRLRHLHVALGQGHESTRSDTFEELSNIPGLPRLETLELQLWPTRTLSVGRLATSEVLSMLTHLSIAHQIHQPDELGRLFESCKARRLQQLDISFTNIGDPEPLQQLLESHILETVHTLLMSRVYLRDTGAEQLASSSHLDHLRTLDLSLNGIGDSGACGLADSLRPVQLTTLDLIYNRIGTAGRTALMRRFGEDVCLFDR